VGVGRGPPEIFAIKFWSGRKSPEILHVFGLPYFFFGGGGSAPPPEFLDIIYLIPPCSFRSCGKVARRSVDGRLREAGERNKKRKHHGQNRRPAVRTGGLIRHTRIVTKLCGLVWHTSKIVLESVSTDIYKVFFEGTIFWLVCKEYLTLVLKYCRLLFSAVISKHFGKNRVIIKICSGCKNMVSQKCAVFIGPPCTCNATFKSFAYINMKISRNTRLFVLVTWQSPNFRISKAAHLTFRAKHFPNCLNAW